MPTLSYVTNFALENLQFVTISKNGSHFHARCPICGDSKKSLKKKRFHLQYDNDDSIYWNCFNCNETGNFIDLYASVNNISNQEAFKELRSLNLDDLKKRISSNSPQGSQEFKASNSSFSTSEWLSESHKPKGIIETKLLKYLYDFRQSRKIPSNIPLYVGYKGRFKSRIIIPIVEDDKIIFFQGRSIFKDQEPKYLNPVAERNQIIYNKNNFDCNSPIIVTEGLLDAFMVEKNGTSILGSSLTDDFIKELKKYTNKNIIIVFDNPFIDDTGKKQLENFIKNSKYSNSVQYFIFSRNMKNIKDLNDLKVKGNINKIYDYVLENAVSKTNVMLNLIK